MNQITSEYQSKEDNMKAYFKKVKKLKFKIEKMK